MLLSYVVNTNFLVSSSLGLTYTTAWCAKEDFNWRLPRFVTPAHLPDRVLIANVKQDGGDGRPRLNGHDRDYEAWQTFVRGFRRNLREGLRVASLSDEAIDNIIQDLPIVEDTIRNMVPDALAHWLITNTQAAAPSGTS